METFRKKTISNQNDIHTNLKKVVNRHLNSEYRRPIAKHTQENFNELLEKIKNNKKPIILDSGCGTGESCINLYEKHPDFLIIGADRSEKRLEKGRANIAKKKYENSIHLIRAELADFWRLCLKNNINLNHHYILYPNPYPKKEHLKRRWHAHPAFIHILALGGELSIRSDWEIYLKEFSTALKLAKKSPLEITSIIEENPITPFEKKYMSQKRKLYELKVSL